MTALAELLDAVRAGNAVGDDATLRAAWETADSVSTMCSVLQRAGHPLAAVMPWHNAAADAARQRRGFLAAEQRLCAGMREAFVCPTWAELTKGGA